MLMPTTGPTVEMTLKPVAEARAERGCEAWIGVQGAPAAVIETRVRQKS